MQPEQLQESEIPWKHSRARKLLFRDLVKGRIPVTSKDENGRYNKPKLADIYAMRPEYADYLYSKFSSRLSSLRKFFIKSKVQQRDDWEAFGNFRANTPLPTGLTSRGTIEYQGSETQRFLRLDIENGRHQESTPMELWATRPEYFEYLPLKEFRDRVKQEVRTAKYIHTLKVKGPRRGRRGSNNS